MMIISQNRLALEKSPYLLQHKNNPVDWYPWGEEAFQVAREENKIIFLSIGYSTCYWCHVMEKDSFERQEVADVMNRHFINIKVDREEHPDVDQIYMDAVMAMTGRGGWPMSVFLTPDLKPFFGGTFFWRAQFIQILEKVNEEWQKNPKNLVDFGDKVIDALRNEDRIIGEYDFDESLLRDAYANLRRRFDPVHGGFGPAPKFPHSMDLSLLLRIHRRTNHNEILDVVTRTLNEMAKGGLYDHIGGGFHRYSTDERWFAPHFEKMLYDNALLTLSYLEAYQVTKNPNYAQVARETLDYVLREMTSPEGGFYSAQDAGEVGKEGDFYTWSEPELKSALSADEFQIARELYHITADGNWEDGKNILHTRSDENWKKEFTPEITSLRQKLFHARDKRNYPHKDDKVLTSWNALMIKAMSKGFQVLREERYLKAAQNAAQFLHDNLYKQDKLLRRYREGDSRFDGTLDDYAFLIDALITLSESDFNSLWQNWAVKLQTQQDELFWDNIHPGYFFSPKGVHDLIIRKKDFHDSALPSGNSFAFLNLLKLHDLTLNPSYREQARKLANVFVGKIKSRSTLGFSYALMGLDYMLEGAKEIAIVTNLEEENVKEIKQFLYQTFLPNQVFSLGLTGSSPLLMERKTVDNKTTVYVCQNHTCLAPTTDMQQAKKLILECKTYSL